MRWLVIAVLVTIIISMASALVFLYRDAGQGRHRMVRALAVRVALSVGLFIGLMLAVKLGFIGPQGLK